MFTTQYPSTHAFIKVLAIEIEELICSFRLCAECLLMKLSELHESIRADNECPLTSTGMAACTRLWEKAAETRLEGGGMRAMDANSCHSSIVIAEHCCVGFGFAMLRHADLCVMSLNTTCLTECVTCRACRSRMIVCPTTEVPRL